MVEILFCIHAADIENGRIRGDFGLTYDAASLRTFDDLEEFGFSVSAVVVNRYRDDIEKELLHQEAKPSDHDVLERHDYLFHDAILRGAGNRMLSAVVRFLDGHLRKSRTITSHTTPDVSKIVGEHRVIFDAIKRGQADLAERAMLEHLQTVGLDLISERKR